MIRAYEDNIFFTTNTRFEEVLDAKGIGGQQLVLNTTWDPDRHSRIYGEVISIPKRLSKFLPIGQDYTGYPLPSPQSDYLPVIKFMKDIVMEVRVGDRIYFNFKTLRYEENFIGYFPVNEEIKPVYKVRYDLVHCVVRDKEIIPIGGHVLLSPDMEDMEDILIPVMSSIKDNEGNLIPLPKDKWIQTKLEPQNKYLRAYVTHIGTPLRGWQCHFKVGDHVIMRKIGGKRSPYPVRQIEGEQYYVTRQRMLDSVIEHN